MVYMSVMCYNLLMDWRGSYRFQLSDRCRFRLWLRFGRRRPLIASDNDLILMPPFVIVMSEYNIVVIPVSGFLTRSLTRPFPLSLATPYGYVIFPKASSRPCSRSTFVAANNDLLFFPETSSGFCPGSTLVTADNDLPLFAKVTS